MRLPPIGELTPRQAEISARITARRGGTRGPFLIWLRSPDLCDRVEALGAYCRFDSALPPHLSELALLVSARRFDAPYSWNAHARKAIDAGLPAGCVERLACDEDPAFPDEDCQVLYEFSTQLLREHAVTAATFDRALALFGERGLVDLIGALGNFTMLAMLLNAFEVDLPQGVPMPFPDLVQQTSGSPALRQ